MAIVFELQDGFVDVNPVTDRFNLGPEINDFGGVSIIGALYNKNVFLPRGILWSGDSIIAYSCRVSQSKYRANGFNKSFVQIPLRVYFELIIPPIPLPPANWKPYFIVAPLEKKDNLMNSKFTVRDALLKIKIDVLFNDPERPPINTDVDFINVQDILVNVGGHPKGAHLYRVPYINPLVIPIP